MVDIGKQIHYWVEGAKEDSEVAQELLSKGRVRHGFFWGIWPLRKYSKPMFAGPPKIWLPDSTI